MILAQNFYALDFLISLIRGITMYWDVVATITAPIITLVLGWFGNRYFESRPALISFYTHISAFSVTPVSGQQPFWVNTHSVVLRNTGRRSATNVRLNHLILPDFNIWPPSVSYEIEILPKGSKDIVIPVLVPGEEITVSYLYYAPTTWEQVNQGIKCDQGFAAPIKVLLHPLIPRWRKNVMYAFMVVGIIAISYLIYMSVVMIFRH